VFSHAKGCQQGDGRRLCAVAALPWACPETPAPPRAVLWQGGAAPGGASRSLPARSGGCWRGAAGRCVSSVSFPPVAAGAGER